MRYFISSKESLVEKTKLLSKIIFDVRLYKKDSEKQCKIGDIMLKLSQLLHNLQLYWMSIIAVLIDADFW